MTQMKRFLKFGQILDRSWGLKDGIRHSEQTYKALHRLMNSRFQKGKLSRKTSICKSQELQEGWVILNLK